jgi:hypothetical protein
VKPVGEEVNFPWGKSISYLTALLRNLPTLWHSNGAGIGFPQRSCKAKARYVAKVLPSGQLGKQGGNNPVPDTNPPEDQEDAVEG